MVKRLGVALRHQRDNRVVQSQQGPGMTILWEVVKRPTIFHCSEMTSEYIIYMDESGDHSLDSINSQFPVFVLSACIFQKTAYSTKIVPAFLELKFKHWNHDMVILHSRDIRKNLGDFAFLKDSALRASFLSDLNGCINGSTFTIISTVIEKNQHKSTYVYPDSPYEIALTFCLERSYGFLRDRGKQGQKTTVVVERRGKQEDDALELVFRRVVQGGNAWGCSFPFDILFADKKTNSIGLQLADLVSYPIGRKQIAPAKPNLAYDTLASKFRSAPNGKIHGWGLKVFP